MSEEILFGGAGTEKIVYTLSESVNTIYDGTAKTVSITVTAPATGATVYYSVGDAEHWVEGCEYSITNATLSPVNVFFKVEAAGYETAVTNAVSISISRKTLTVSGTAAMEKKYDGNTAAGVILGEVSGIVEGDAVTVNASGSFDSADAGNRVVAVNYTLTGAKSGNYQIAPSENVGGKINKRNVTVTSGSGSWGYDGEAHTNESSTVSGDGFIGSEGVNCSYTGSQTIVGASANTFTYTLKDGTKEGNYNITQKYGTLEVIITDPLVVKDGAVLPLYKDASVRETDIIDGGELTLNSGAKFTTGVLKLDDGLLVAENGSAMADKIFVNGGSNEITGDFHTVNTGSQVTVETGAELDISKKLYDEFMDLSYFLSNGVINVGPDSEDLDQGDIEDLLAKKTVRAVMFQQDLTDIRKLAFNDNSVLTAGFLKGYGTNGNDTVTFGKNSCITLIAESIDFLNGNNTIQLKNNAVAVIDAAVDNIAKVTLDAGKEVKVGDVKTQEFTTLKMGDFTFDEDRDGRFVLNKFTNLYAGTVTGGYKKTYQIAVAGNSSVHVGDVYNVNQLALAAGSTYKAKSTDLIKTQGITVYDGGDFIANTGKSAAIKIQKFSSARFADIVFGSKTDVISVDADSSFFAESINFGGGTDTFNVNGRAKAEVAGDVREIRQIKLNNGKLTSDGIEYTELSIGGKVTMSAKSDNLNVGNYSSVSVGQIDFGSSSDVLKIGTDSVMTAGILAFGDGTDALTIGGRSALTVNDYISGIEKINLSNGRSTGGFVEETSMVINGDLVLTVKNDTVNIGNYANFMVLGKVDFSAEQSSIITGDKDTIKVGNYSTVVLKTDDSGSLNKFTIGKGCSVYLSSELLYRVTKIDASSAVYDIGDWEVAQYFRGIEDENKDDFFNSARILEAGTETYNGWLCGEDAMDTVDYFNCESIASVSGSASQLLITQYNAAGSRIGEAVAFTGTIDLNSAAVAFSISFADDHIKDAAVSYSMQLTQKPL